jgi:hypothetical protein
VPLAYPASAMIPVVPVHGRNDASRVGRIANMTPPIKRDERTWLVAIHSDACALVIERRVTECCSLLDEPNDACTLENCPRKLMAGGYRLEEVYP